MRTALTILAVAVGKLLCRLGRHKWGPWNLAPSVRVRFRKLDDAGLWIIYEHWASLPAKERKCKRCGLTVTDYYEWSWPEPTVWIDPFGYYENDFPNTMLNQEVP